MDSEIKNCVILTTTDNSDEADRLAEALIARRLAACVQISGISSCFAWEGKIEKAREYLLLIKTRRSLFGQVESFILSEHSYAVPEIVLLPIERGSAAYLNWIKDNTFEVEVHNFQNETGNSRHLNTDDGIIE